MPVPFSYPAAFPVTLRRSAAPMRPLAATSSKKRLTHPVQFRLLASIREHNVEVLVRVKDGLKDRADFLCQAAIRSKLADETKRHSRLIANIYFS